MAPYQTLLLTALLLSAPLAASPLYLIRCGQVDQALVAYEELRQKNGKHDFELLRSMAHAILDLGSKDSDPEVQLLSCYGAALSGDEQAFAVFERCVTSKIPELQMACLRVLANMHNDAADQILKLGMTSNLLILRLETLNLMVLKKMPGASLQAEALLVKVPKEIHPLFAPLFAKMGDAASLKMLRKFLNDPYLETRLSAILAIARANIDSFAGTLRRFLMHPSPVTLEAAAFAMGQLKDENSRKELERLTESSHEEVRLAASYSLHLLGSTSAEAFIRQRAVAGSLFAVSLLGEIEGSEDTLVGLLQSKEPLVKINAVLALLRRKDPRCLNGLIPLLLKDSRDVALLPYPSPGRALEAWKVVPSAKQNLENDPMGQELALRIKEEILIQAADLPHPAFIAFANQVLQSRQNLLIPTLVRLLEASDTKEATALLEKHQHIFGAPFIRRSCLLALYRLDSNPSRAKEIRSWVREKSDIPVIRFRPLVPLNADYHTAYQLTPEEASRLLIDSLEALVEFHDDEAVEVILEAMEEGNPKNKFALAGLLIRATH